MSFVQKRVACLTNFCYTRLITKDNRFMKRHDGQRNLPRVFLQ